MVYGEKGEVNFDESLSPTEKTYVERFFGDTLQPNGDFRRFTHSAQYQGLQKYVTQYDLPQCQEAVGWDIIKSSDPKLGEAIVLGGTHHCMRQYQDLVLDLGLEAQFANHPEDWLFLIETSRSVEAVTDSEDPLQDEYALFHRLHERLGIPMKNPLIPADSDEVRVEVAKQGYKKFDLIFHEKLHTVLIDAMDNPQVRSRVGDLSREEDLKYLYDLAVMNLLNTDYKDNSRFRDFPRRGISYMGFKTTAERKLTVPPGKKPGEYFGELLEEKAHVFLKKIEASNKLSEPRVRDLLAKYNKPRVLVQIGADHTPIFKEIYAKWETLAQYDDQGK